MENEDKDATDAELALSIAADHGVDSIHVISGGGDRLDHVLGSLHVLAAPALRGVRTMCTTGRTHIHVVTSHHRETFDAITGDTISESMRNRLKRRVMSDRGVQIEKKYYPQLFILLTPGTEKLEREASAARK